METPGWIRGGGEEAISPQDAKAIAAHLAGNGDIGDALFAEPGPRAHGPKALNKVILGKELRPRMASGGA